MNNKDPNSKDIDAKDRLFGLDKKFIDKITKNFKKKNKIKCVPVYKLFKYTELIDKIMIFLGIFSAFSSGALFPVTFYYYGKIAATFVDYEQQLLAKNSSLYNISSLNQSAAKINCSNAINLDTDYDGRIKSNVNGFLIISFLSLAANYIASVTFNTVAERQIKRLRQFLFESILRQNMAFFDKNNPGELNTVMTSNLESLKGAINYKFSDFISQFCRGCACIIFAIIAAWKFTLPFLTIVPFMIISLNLMIHYIKKYSIQEFMAYGGAGKIAQETLSSLRTVISFGIHHKAIKLYDENLKAAEKVSIKKGYLKGFFEGAYFGLFNLIFGIAIYYAVYLNRIDCENYYPGNLMAAFFCIVMSSISLGQAIPFINDLTASRGVAKKLFDLIELKSSIDIMNTKPATLNDLKGDISFHNVYFNYPQRPDAKILNGLTLDIPAGKTVAFCGASGCGKSTTFCLLQRFYSPLEGEIRIDGQKIEDLNLIWMRKQMALVSQEPSLFTTTIRENIRLGRVEATDEEIVMAAKNANAHDFIMKLVDNYDTKVGERGVSLSGGQKQRIAIARALIRNPRILLLDEATSALDSESEKVVQDALDKAKKGRTTIIIAHRLSTIRNADLIVSFEGGRVKEKGTHNELMAAKGIYYELVNRQTLNTKKEVGLSREAEVEEISSSDLDSEQEVDGVKEVFDEQTPSKVAFNGPVETEKDAKNKLSRLRLRKPANKPFYLERKLWRIQRPELKWNLIGTVSQLINGLIFPGISLIFCEIYNLYNIVDETVQKNKSLEYLGYICGMGVVNFIVLLAYNYSFALAGARLTKRIRSIMFESMLRQEIGFHDLDQNRSSILAVQLTTNPPFCKGLTTDKIGILSQGFSGIGFAIVIAFVINWKLSFIMLLFVPISFFSGVFAGRTSFGNVKVKGRSSVEEGGRILIETIENIRTTVSLGHEKYFIKEMNKLFDQGHQKTLLSLHQQAFFYTVSNTLIFFIQITAFSYGWVLIKEDGLPIANLYRVYAVMTFSSLILGRCYATLPDQKKAKTSTKNAFKIIERKSRIDSISNEGLKPELLIGNIEFKNVYFEYPTRPGIKILKNFNLFITNGQTNALVGQSGCGKSTTISLLTRFYDVTGGSVELDGVDIRRLNIEWLRSQIGIVSQEPVLFDYSIKENILNGDLMKQDVLLEDVMKVAIESNIHNRIDNLPEKYETIVGQKGSQLSGGEKQRIAIARALLRNPKILLLDEATSALDTQSEQVVQSALDKAQKGRTCLVIAHRLSTIESSDKICVVKDGNVVESGTHSELMALNGYYFVLQNPNLKFKSTVNKLKMASKVVKVFQGGK